MARTASGYQVRWKGPGRGWTVRFRLRGQREERATGVKDRRAKGAAEEAAREIYARAVRGEQRAQPAKPQRQEDLVEVTSQWLDSLSIRPVTRGLYEKYAGYWVERWATLDELTSSAIALYSRHRLKTVRGKSVANEMSALRGLLEWCGQVGLLSELPAVPRVTRAEGTPYAKRTRVAAPELSQSEVWAVINALPEFSGRGWPVRARAIVAYTTSLRPTALDKLRVPEHYSPGAATLRITDDLDKEAFARDLPLPPIARQALDSVCPEVGLIFGRHRITPYIQRAAAQVLAPHKAAVLTGQHFRSAALTHMLEGGASLPGTQYIAGHKHVSTTSRYVRPSFRAAAEAMRIWGTGSGDGQTRNEKTTALDRGLMAPEVGLEPAAVKKNA